MTDGLPKLPDGLDPEEFLRTKLKIRKKKRRPNTPRGYAYQMRWAEDGTIWHSRVDIDRPNSPPVEWPEYKGMEIHDPDRPKELPPLDPKYQQILDKVFVGPEDYVRSKSSNLTPEVPDDKEDEKYDEFDSVALPTVPGLYDADNKGGGLDDDDDYDDDYNDGFTQFKMPGRDMWDMWKKDDD